MDSSDSKEARVKARRTLPGHVFRRGELEVGGPDPLTPSDRVDAVWRITQDLWASAGREIVHLPRAEWPGRVIRLP